MILLNKKFANQTQFWRHLSPSTVTFSRFLIELPVFAALSIAPSFSLSELGIAPKAMASGLYRWR
jgi:hypothetical protein